MSRHQGPHRLKKNHHQQLILHKKKIWFADEKERKKEILLLNGTSAPEGLFSAKHGESFKTVMKLKQD